MDAHPMIIAAAKALCKQSAEACNVNSDDDWKLYGEMYIFDAQVALMACGALDLLEALTKLLNEANAIAEMARPSIGNSNVGCLLTRCAEAHAAIAKAAGAA